MRSMWGKQGNHRYARRPSRYSGWLGISLTHVDEPSVLLGKRKLTIMRLLMRLQMLLHGETRSAPFVCTRIRLCSWRHVREDNVVSEEVGLGECRIASLALLVSPPPP